MHEPAKTPLEVIFQLLEMKPMGRFQLCGLNPTVEIVPYMRLLYSNSTTSVGKLMSASI